jgi:hypothetical protein
MESQKIPHSIIRLLSAPDLAACSRNLLSIPNQRAFFLLRAEHRIMKYIRFRMAQFNGHYARMFGGRDGFQRG